jgi:acetyl-CoA carboxylase biotin carboxyl carrier protein
MIDPEFLERLIKAIDESGLDSIEIERGGTRVRLSKTPDFIQAAPAPTVSDGAPQWSPAAPAPVMGAAAPGGTQAEPEDAAPAAPASNLVDIESPMVGTFYRAPAPDAPSYVDTGSRVGKGDTVCIIEAMKLMNELECDVSGTIVEICVENAQPVEYGQVLFRVDPS